MSHFRHRTDANTKAIAEAFEQLGCLVHRSNGSWDLTVCKPSRPGSTRLIEVKDLVTPSKVTPAQAKLRDLGWPILRVESLEDVEAVVKQMS